MIAYGATFWRRLDRNQPPAAGFATGMGRDFRGGMKNIGSPRRSGLPSLQQEPQRTMVTRPAAPVGVEEDRAIPANDTFWNEAWTGTAIRCRDVAVEITAEDGGAAAFA
jgi:hypothetical protein